MSHNWDALGLRPTKPLHPLFTSNFDYYQAAIDWIRAVLRRHGFEPDRATLDPPTERWHFYTLEGDLIVSVSHDTVDRVRENLRAVSVARVAKQHEIDQEDAA